jgi:hypothetical protein
MQGRSEMKIPPVWVACIAFLFGAGAGGVLGTTLSIENEAPSKDLPPVSGNWTEFHAAWQRGGLVKWMGREVTVDNATSWATDGETYLYAVKNRTEDERARAACRAEERLAGTAGAWVLLNAAPCSWARHPAVSCSATDVCTKALGAPAPGGGGSGAPPPI